MRLATIQTSDGPRAALLHDGAYIDLHAADAALPISVRQLLEGGPEMLKAAKDAGARPGATRIPSAGVKLLPPIPDPPKIICMGLNYSDHAAETGAKIPSEPVLFSKFATALIGAEESIVLPAVSKKVDYEAELVLVVGKKGRPANDLKGLMAYLKANPGKASVGIAGVGATGHLTGISFQKETGTKFQFVPYRGNGPAMQDLLAEQIDFMIEPSSNFKSLVGAGSIKPYAITGKARLPSSPAIPTADEAGLPGFFASLW